MILCDLDMVLATSYGSDTVPGQPIHKTFREHPEQLDAIKDDGIPFYIVTAKVEREARRVLRAIGFEGYVTSVIGADRLLWPTLWRAMKQRRIPTFISKALWRSAIRGAEASRKADCVVMIEDRRSNLLDMLEYGSIDVGILVPQIRVEGDSVVEWFDLDVALRLARKIVLQIDAGELLSTGPVRIYQWSESGLESCNISALCAGRGRYRYLIEMPALSSILRDQSPLALGLLETGHTLEGDILSMTSLLRACKRLGRRLRAVGR